MTELEYITADTPVTLADKFDELQRQFKHATEIILGMRLELSLKDAQIEALVAAQCACSDNECHCTNNRQLDH